MPPALEVDGVDGKILKTMPSQLTKKMYCGLTNIDAMYLWQRPSALRRLAVKVQSEMTCEAFLSRGGSREQKIQEALVGGTFLSIFQRIASPVMARMARINEEALDVEARTADGVIYQLEITAAYPPSYKIREAYRNGSKPEIPWSAFTGEPIPAEQIASSISNKTEKIRGKGIRRHLVVYNDISGGTTDLWRLPQLLGHVQKEWDSIWLIAGVPDIGWVALVSDSVGFKRTMLGKKKASSGMPNFWGYRIDRSGVKVFRQTNEVNKA